MQVKSDSLVEQVAQIEDFAAGNIDGRAFFQRNYFTAGLDLLVRRGLILAPADYVRWLSDEPDPRDLMRPYPAAPMRMWPISTRVNKPENDDPSILQPIAFFAA